MIALKKNPKLQNAATIAQSVFAHTADSSKDTWMKDGMEN
jgi:hypothetical protein